MFFDDLCLMSGGKICYFGPVPSVDEYFKGIGYEMPLYINPAEYLLDLVSSDFGDGKSLMHIHDRWAASPLETNVKHLEGTYPELSSIRRANGRFSVVLTLLYRSWLKSYRDVIAYHVRIIMYTGMSL